MGFCVRTGNQKIFHPEIREEIRFAFEQLNTTSDLDAMLKSFMDKDENWDLAEEDIGELRSSEEPPDSSVTDILAGVVKDEVDYAYAMWAEDHEKAVMYGRKVVDGLSGSKVAPYRAFWCYSVAAAAHLQTENDKKFEQVAVDFLNRAKEACRTVSWFPYALKSILPERGPVEDASELQALATESMVDLLVSLGPTGPRFQKKMEEVESLLKAREPKDFDRGLVELGQLLGFNSWKPPGKAAPDCVWQLGDQLLFVLEGKSDEAPEGGISVQNCRQASGHLDWAAANSSLKDIKTKYSILVSPKSSIDADAVPHGKDIYLLGILETFRLFEKAKSILLESRETMTTNTNTELGDRVLQGLIRTNLTPEEIRVSITSKPVTELPIHEQQG
jgi:hypothetical protein